MANTFGDFVTNKWVEQLCDIIAEDNVVCFFRINTKLTNGTIIFDDRDLEGQPYTIQSVPENIGCCSSGDNTSDLVSVETNLTVGGTLNYGSNSIHSLSIYVITGTLDINGVTLPANTVRNISGDSGKNNILTVQNIDNVTGTAFVVMTQYV